MPRKRTTDRPERSYDRHQLPHTMDGKCSAPGCRRLAKSIWGTGRTLCGPCAKGTSVTITCMCGVSFVKFGTTVACSERCKKKRRDQIRIAKGDVCNQPDCGNARHYSDGTCKKHYFNGLAGLLADGALNPEKRRAQNRVSTLVRRARQRQLPRQSVRLEVVGERDHWTCGLCKEHVDQELDYPDPMSPSIDHIIHLYRGGHHRYENVRLTHLKCNLDRGMSD